MRIDLANVTGEAGVTGVEWVSDAGADDTYALGERIRVQVTFSTAVEVDTTGGTPGVTIDMDPADWGEKRAAYESGSGTDTLVFAHEVVEPNLSTEGIAVLANTLAFHGGTIRSAATQQDASLGHAGIDHDPAHKVDWRLAADPVGVTGVEIVSEAGADGAYTEGRDVRGGGDVRRAGACGDRGRRADARADRERRDPAGDVCVGLGDGEAPVRVPGGRGGREPGCGGAGRGLWPQAERRRHRGGGGRRGGFARLRRGAGG